MMNATTRLADRVKLKDAHLITRMTDIAEGLTDVIKLGRGDPDLDTPAHIIKAGQNALGNGATHYTHPLGLPALRLAIVVTPGGQHAMFIIALALLNPGDEILVPCPGYNPYHQAAEMAGAETVHIRMSMETNFTLTAEMVEAHITPRSKILVLINPSNPTGTVTPPSEVRRIAEVARKHDLIVISDEIYARLTYGNNTVQPVASLPGMFDRTITLSGFSKAYAMTGWRIGYFAGPPDLIPALAEINHAFAISTAAASQHAAIAALTGSQDCVEEMRQIYDARRIALCAALTEMGIPYAEPQGAFYVYANVASTGIGATAFCERLLREGQVLMYPGGIYGDYTDDFVRMSLTQPVDRIREAITRMKTVVASIRTETVLRSPR
jgi:aminotransferase